MLVVPLLARLLWKRTLKALPQLLQHQEATGKVWFPAADVGGGGGRGGRGRTEGWGLLKTSPRCILPAFCWDGERPVSDGQRSVPRGKAGIASGTEGDTGGGAADSGPQRTARQWQGAQILHCCRSLPPPPPQRTSKQRNRDSEEVSARTEPQNTT